MFESTSVKSKKNKDVKIMSYSYLIKKTKKSNNPAEPNSIN